MGNFVDSILGTSNINIDAQPVTSGNEYSGSKVNSYSQYTDDPLIAAIIHQESRGNAKAVSPKGAAGLMQLMPETARSLGLRVDNEVDERFDPEKNIEAGTRYFKNMLEAYGNDPQLALMAYNWGPGSVNKWIASGADYNSIPDETKDYIRAISQNDPSNFSAADRLLGVVPTFKTAVGGSFGGAFPGGELVTSPNEPANVAYQSTLENMWNSFKAGINQTQIGFSRGVKDDYEQIIDEYPLKRSRLESAYNSGGIDAAQYQAGMEELASAYQEAKGKIEKYNEDIASDEVDLSKAPVSNEYTQKQWLTQSEGSDADTWDRIVYTAPEVVGSSASLMGSQLALTFGTKAAKQLIAAGLEFATPEPVASKIAAVTTLASAIALAANARDTETYAEIGGALEENQKVLLANWLQEHPDQEPSEDDMRLIRMKAREGKQEMYRENMSLMVPDLVEALVAPYSNLGDLFTTLSKPIRTLNGTISKVKDLNKFTRIGTTLGKGYVDYLSEKIEEGSQYAYQQRQQSQALDLGLYQNHGFMRDLITDSKDVLKSLNYSPIGVVRNSDGRYSKDRNFQFSEEAGGLLSFLPAAITTAHSVHKDVATYRKVTKALSDNPFVDPDEKLLKLKSEIYQKSFEGNSVHHLIEGLKSLRNQTDVEGKPLLSEEDYKKEVSNIKTAYHKYKAVNDYINTLGGMFESADMKQAKAGMKESLFHSVIGEMEYDHQLKEKSAAKSKFIAPYIGDPKVQLEDLNNKIFLRENVIQNLQTDIANNTDEAVLYDFQEKLGIAKAQLRELKKNKASLIKEYGLKGDEESLNYPLEAVTINKESFKPELLRDLFRQRYEDLKSIRDPRRAKEWLNSIKKDIEQKQTAYSNVAEKNIKEEEEQKKAAEPKTGAEQQPVPETQQTSQVSGTVQKVGDIEEYPILKEYEDSEGFMNYDIAKPDGTVETVSQKGSWYKTNEMGNEAREEPREILYGAEHFLVPYRYNLSREAALLRKLEKRLNKSQQEILEQYPDAFPAHANKSLLDKILNQDNPKDFIDIVVTDKFSRKNEGLDPIVFSSSTGLYGLRTQGVSILLRLTDPENPAVQMELFEIHPPDFYAIRNKEGQLVQLDFTNGDLMNFEIFKSMFVSSQGEFTPEDFRIFVRNWKSVKDFKTALQTFIKDKNITEPIVVTKNSYELDVTGVLDIIIDPKKPFIKMKDSPLLENAPIFYYNTDPALTHWVTNDTVVPEYMLSEDTTGYYAAVYTKAGFKWVKLTPGKIVSTDEREQIVASEVKRIVDELYALDPNDPNSYDQAKRIVRTAKFYVASYGNLEITPFAKEMAGHYTLEFGIRKGKIKYKSVYMDKLLKNGAEVDYNYKFIKDRINNTLLENGLTDQINESNFRYNPSKSIRESEYTDSGNVRDLFDAVVHPNVVTNLSPRFYLGSNRGNVTNRATPSKPTPVNSAPKPTPASDSSVANNNPTLNNPEDISSKEAEEKKNQNDIIDGALKVAERGDIDYPVSLAEQESYLASILPKEFTREDIKQLHANVVKNGIPVGAVIGKTIYLREVADKSDLFHEAFHVVFRNLLSEDRIQAYLNKAASELGYTKEKLEKEKDKLRSIGMYANYTEQQLEDQVYEEYLADNFFEWKKGESKKSWLIQLFNKIMNLIRYFTTDDVRGLYAGIDRGYFKNSSVLKTRYNSQGSTNTAYKLLVGSTQIQTSQIVNQILAKALVEGMPVRQALNFFIEFYNPDSKENQTYIAGSSIIRDEFAKFQNIFLESANQRLIYEIVSKKLTALKMNKQSIEDLLEEFDFDQDRDTKEISEKQWDLSDAYIDPYTRLGRKVKAIMETTTYKDYFNGKEYQRVLDSRIFYGRMLPLLSITNTAPNMIMSKLRALSSWDPQIKAFYERVMEVTKYSHETGEAATINGKQIYKSLIKAFEVEQLIYFEPVANLTPGQITTSVNSLNKIDLGKYRMTEWANYWRTNVITGILADKKAKNSILSGIKDFITKLDEAKGITRSQVEGVKKSLDRLGIKLEIPYLLYSFGTTKEAEDLKSNLSLRPMTREDLLQIAEAVRTNSDLFAKTTAANKAGAQGRMLDIANGHAIFDTDLILKTYQDPEGKLRYAYVASNMALTETRRLRSLTTRAAVNEEMEKNNGYYSLNPLFTKVDAAINIFKNLTIGLTNSFRTAVDIQDVDTKETKEAKNKGVTGTDMDADTMIGVTHILFTSTFKNASTKINYGRYWLTQVSDKNTQYAVEMPVSRFWDNEKGFSDDAKEKLFNLVKQEYRRNQGDFGKYIKKDKFLYFPFLSPSLLNGTMQDLENQKDEILAQIEKEFKELANKHKLVLQEKTLMIGEDFTFLDTKKVKDEYGDVNTYLMNFISNQFIYTTGLLQFYAGDIAWSKNWSDFVKRMAGVIASGNTLGDQEFLLVHTTDSVSYLDKSTLDDVKQGSENSVENNDTDAQVWSTAATKKMISDELGELSETLSRAFDKIIAGQDSKLTAAEKAEVDAISDKLVGYGIDTDGNRQYNKQSTFYLTIGLTSMKDKEGNWVAQPHREPLHNIRVYLENLSKNKQPVLLSPKSANKLYKSPDPVNLDDFKNTSDVKTESSAVTRMSGQYMRKQQENDTKEKDSIVFVRQLIDVLGSEIKDPAMRQVIEQFRNDLAIIRNEAFDFASRLLVNQVEDRYERADLEIWLENVRHTIEVTTPDNQMLEYLNLPEVDLNLPHIQSKTKLMFLNTFKKAFQKRVSGRKCTLVSSYGFNIVIDKSTGKVVPTEDIIASKNPGLYKDTDKYEIRSLRIHKIEKDSEGNVVKQEAELLMTRKTAERQGINISDPTKDDYMKVFGVRIPLQSYHSTVVGRIADFLPDYYGDTIVGPKHIVYLGSMDYDVDALYMFLPNAFINEQGESVLYGKETSDEERYYGFKEFLFKNNTILAREVNKVLFNNDDFKALKAEMPFLDDNISEASEISVILSIFDGKGKENLVRQLTQDAVSQVLSKFGYPATLDDFITSGIESEGTIQNRIYENARTIMMSEELSEAYKQPANHDKVDDSISYLERIGALDPNRKVNIIPNTPISIADAYTNATQGKNLTGTAVNANTVGATLTEYTVNVKSPASIVFGTEIDELGRQVAKVYRNFESEKEVHRMKADAASTTVTATVDNANKDVAKDLNFSRHTIPQRNILIQLGVTDYQFIDSFFNLPIMRTLVQKLENADSAISKRSYDVDMDKTSLYLRISGVVKEMKARGFKDLDEHIDKEYQRLETQIFTKKELEGVHVLSKNPLLTKNPSALSNNELKNALSYHMIQLVALRTYEQLDHIAEYAQMLSRIMSLNRTLVSDLGFLEEYIASMEALLSPNSPFELEGIQKIFDNPNVKSNLANVQKIMDISQLFFLDNTDFMKEFKSRLNNNFTLKRSQSADVRRNFLSFLMGKLLKKVSGTNYDPYYELVIPEYTKGSKTLAQQFNDLIKTDNDGKPIKPEFYNNPFVKILEPMMAEDSMSSAIDILGVDSRAKFSPETLDKYIDSIDSFTRSSDPEIKAFTINMLKYLIAKDSLQFRNYSFIKLLPAFLFRRMAEVLGNMNKALAYEKFDTSEVKELTGQDSESLYKEFFEIFARTNPGLVTKMALGDVTQDGRPKSDNVANVKGREGIEGGPQAAFRYDIGDNILKLTQVTNDPTILNALPNRIKKFVNSSAPGVYILNFPSAISVNGNKSYIYIETARAFVEGKTVVTYKRVSSLNTPGILPYFTSIEATERASNIINFSLREKAKKAKSEAATSTNIDPETGEDNNTPPGKPPIPRSPKNC